MQGTNFVGVQFRRAGKLYDFASGDIHLQVGDHVVVETDRGPSLARVARIGYEQADKSKGRTLKSILRRATSKELSGPPRISEEEATSITKDLVAKHKLKMRILKAEIQFGGNKVIVYFTAPGRVDFRNLVKELASSLRTRVELTQIGARDETKLLGGMGICGREFCCSTFLREFLPVSIKMAKNQNLALNPSKVSGGCGRLLCCLTYEDEVYTSLRKQLPAKGARLRLLDRGEEGVVIRTDVLNQLALVKTEESVLTVSLKDTEVIGRPEKPKPKSKDKVKGKEHDKEQRKGDRQPGRSGDEAPKKAAPKGQSEEAEAWAEDLDLSEFAGEMGQPSPRPAKKPSGQQQSQQRDPGSPENPENPSGDSTEAKADSASGDQAAGQGRSRSRSRGRGRGRNRNRKPKPKPDS